MARRLLPIAVLLLAAAPARPSPPTTAPADRDTVEYVAAPVHAHFRVPKTWQHRDVAAMPADVGFLFDPAPATTKKKNVMFQQFVEITLSPAKADETTIAAVADAARTELLRNTPTIKFTKDAAATFAGRAVWTLQWTEKIPLTGPAGADGKPQRVGFLDFDRVTYVWPERGTACRVGLHADTRFIPTLTQKAATVAKTLAWDD